jgi:hypothetical protein
MRDRRLPRNGASWGDGGRLLSPGAGILREGGLSRWRSRLGGPLSPFPERERSEADMARGPDGVDSGRTFDEEGPSGIRFSPI